MANKYWSFQSVVFIFRGGNDHDVTAPEVPDCCEMERHVGDDHQILEQGEKRVTCNVEQQWNWSDQKKFQKICCSFSFLETNLRSYLLPDSQYMLCFQKKNPAKAQQETFNIKKRTFQWCDLTSC